MVSFLLHPIQRNSRIVINCSAKLIDTRVIKSSNGHLQERLTIETPVEINGQVWPIEVTLTNRSDMGFRLLLGRAAIKNNYVVDPSHSFLFRKKNYGSKMYNLL